MLAVLLAFALAAASSLQESALASQPKPDAEMARVRARLETPNRLAVPDITPDFKVKIEVRRPLQDIFDIPPWQLDPIGWRPPAIGFDLGSLIMSGVQGIATAKRHHDERLAREEVQQAIVEYCAAQPNRATITICAR